MKKNSLTPNKGLSLSQAQSISNLCNQRALEIGNQLSVVNNFSKSVEVDGTEHVTIKPRKIPENVTDLLREKATLHGCQAFLMENLKAKEHLLKEAKSEQADISGVKFPEEPEYINPKIEQPVAEDWGWSQLPVNEINEYLEAEAYAAHIGEFIHNGGVLDLLRKELPTLPDIEWMTIKDGVKSPVKINIHHTSEDLLKVHEALAADHRKYEQRVNYFKAKVKNLTTEENARIAKDNADKVNNANKINNDKMSEYDVLYKKASEDVKSLKAEFEKTRQAKIKEIASMRIDVDQRFQNTIDHFLGQLQPEA